MASAPDRIVLKRDRDLVGRKHELWVRRSLFLLLPLIALVALGNGFGQRPTTTVAEVPAASLELETPARLRSGLIYQARITIDAHTRIDRPVLVLDGAWLESMTTNTIEPAPVDERSVDGSPAFELHPIAGGRRFVLYLQFQVNPTNVGRRKLTLTLLDGARPLTALTQMRTVFP